MKTKENFPVVHVESKPTPKAVDGLPAPPLSPAEFGRRYGRSAAFAYRMIYQGRVKVIPGIRFAIPIAEVLRFESETVVYNGRRTRRRQK